MKIIIVGKNYGDEAGPEPLVSMKPDSTLLTHGKPFFLPHFDGEVVGGLSVVVRICRLGKCIASRFAHRYYQEVSVGIDWTARGLQERLLRQGWSWELSKAFDNSAVLGDFVALSELGMGVQELPFRLDVDGETVQQDNTARMRHRVDETIAYVSRYMTLKMGDLIFTGSPAGDFPARIGQHLQGYIGDRKLLDFQVK